MAFKVEFTFNSLDELKNFLDTTKKEIPAEETNDGPANPIPPFTKENKAAVRGQKRPTAMTEKEVIGGTPTTKIPFKGPQPEPKAVEQKKAESNLKYDDVANATMAAVKAGHRTEVIKLLTKHGAVNDKGNPDAKAMDSSNWEAYIKDCNKLVAEPDEEALT